MHTGLRYTWAEGKSRTRVLWGVNRPSPPDPEIVNFGDPNGHSPPENQPKKWGASLSGGFWGGEGPLRTPKIDDFRIRRRGCSSPAAFPLGDSISLKGFGGRRAGSGNWLRAPSRGPKIVAILYRFSTVCKVEQITAAVTTTRSTFKIEDPGAREGRFYGPG